ncbi:MAG: hypothetical protein DWQ10_13055 [Calditrichaeota bacterium]|nr:MAG: hypothetical protein DWQ10_13055 [Calditrichota bacterium]
MDKPYEKYFDDVVHKVQEGMSALAAKTDELTQKGKIKFEILSIKRDLDKYFNDLGKLVFELASEDENTALMENDAVKSNFEKIKELNVKLTEKKEQYEKVAKADAETESEAKQEPDTNFV